VKKQILSRLRDSSPAADPESAALANLPHGVTPSLFPEPLTPAAVLVPVVERSVGMTILLTQRAEQLKDHPGQISFPGGRAEAIDRDPTATALREAAEEIGLSEDFVEVAGFLEPHAIVTGFAVTPVVGFVRTGFKLELDAVEVVDAFEVPLAFFFEPANLRRLRRVVRGTEFEYFEYRYQHRQIWGATAQILQSFITKIN